jgi:hypothetical protein
MYIDGWTITALVIFLVMLAVFVRFCRVKLCGTVAPYRQDRSKRDVAAAGEEA